MATAMQAAGGYPTGHYSLQQKWWIVSVPLEVIIDLERGNDKAQIRGHGLVEGQHLQALLLHVDFHIVDLVVIVDGAGRHGRVPLFDGVHQETLKIDLWTKDMMVSEMDRFMFQTLRALSETYFKASQNAALANEMQRFVQYFGEKTEVISPEK